MGWRLVNCLVTIITPIADGMAFDIYCPDQMTIISNPDTKNQECLFDTFSVPFSAHKLMCGWVEGLGGLWCWRLMMFHHKDATQSKQARKSKHQVSRLQPACFLASTIKNAQICQCIIYTSNIEYCQPYMLCVGHGDCERRSFEFGGKRSWVKAFCKSVWSWTHHYRPVNDGNCQKPYKAIIFLPEVLVMSGLPIRSSVSHKGTISLTFLLLLRKQVVCDGKHSSWHFLILFFADNFDLDKCFVQIRWNWNVRKGT